MKTSIDPTNLFRSLGGRKIAPEEVSANQHDLDLLHIRPYEVISPHVQVRFEFVMPTVTRPSNITEFERQSSLLKEPLKKATLRILNAMKIENLIHGDLGYMNNMEELSASMEGQQEIINRFLNSLLVNVSINRTRSGPGTATLTFRTDARHVGPLVLDIASNFLTQWLLRPHIILTIWSRGRIYTDRMFPRFTGLTVSVAPVNQGGFASIVVEAQDMTKFLAMSIFNVNPAMYDMTEIEGTNAAELTFHGNVFWGMKSFDIVNALLTGGITTNPVGRNEIPELRLANSNGVFLYSTIKEDDEIKDYYNDTSLKTQDVLSHSVSRESLIPFKHVQWGNSLIPYRIFTLSSPDMFKSDRRPKWDIIREIATRTFSEFFCDARGSFVFHPIRTPSRFLYGLALKSTKKDGIPELVEDPWRNARVIDEGDIINFNPTFSDAELVTYVALYGDFFLSGVPAELVGLVDADIDPGLAVYFGYRRKDINVPLINDLPLGEDKNKVNYMMKEFINAHMRLCNADLLHCQLSIPDRPELDLGMPILVQESSSVGVDSPVYYYFYIDSLSTSISIGGEANMTVGLNYGTILGKDVKSPYKPIDFWDALVQGDIIIKESELGTEEAAKKIQEEREKERKRVEAASSEASSNSLTPAEVEAIDALKKESPKDLRNKTLEQIKGNPSWLDSDISDLDFTKHSPEDANTIQETFLDAKNAINHVRSN